MAATIRKGSPWRDHRGWDAGIPRGAARFRATRTTKEFRHDMANPPGL